MNNLMPAGELAVKTNYHLLKSSIPPAWDPNPNGGMWIINAPKRPEDVNQMWENMQLALIGDQLDAEGEEPEALGASYRARQRGSRFELWTKNAKRKEATERIGRRLKDLLGLRASEGLVYKGFHDMVAGKDGPMYRI